MWQLQNNVICATIWCAKLVKMYSFLWYGLGFNCNYFLLSSLLWKPCSSLQVFDINIVGNSVITAWRYCILNIVLSTVPNNKTVTIAFPAVKSEWSQWHVLHHYTLSIKVLVWLPWRFIILSRAAKYGRRHFTRDWLIKQDWV